VWHAAKISLYFQYFTWLRLNTDCNLESREIVVKKAVLGAV
jgi:hypothetical protein